MSKLLENEKSLLKKKKEQAIYFNCPVNKILRDYINSCRYGTKSEAKQKLSKKIGISTSKFNRCISGYATIEEYEILKKLSTYLKIPVEDLTNSKQNINNKEKILKLMTKGISKKYTLSGVKVFSTNSCNVLSNHLNKKKLLFAVKDIFIEFLDFMIYEEDFIENLSVKALDIFEGFYNAKDVKILLECSNYNEFKEKLNTIKNETGYSKNLKKNSKKIDDLILKNQIRQDVKEIITKYIYYKLNEKLK